LPSDPTKPSWDALILAAGRGPADPIARAFGVTHKCLLTVAGKPMLQRVTGALLDSGRFGTIGISIEDRTVLAPALGPLLDRVTAVASDRSASLSVAAAVRAIPLRQPVLVTTADHPLLRNEIITEFLDRSAAAAADLTVGLATAEVILSAYPAAHRTFLTFGPDRVSGCNLYGFNTPAALKILDHWHRVENDRKRPWRLVRSFGIIPLLRYALGTLTLSAAFDAASRTLGLKVKPVLLPFAEGAIDVDKPADLELAERILAGV
jgi:GTP:adenosylcobinamide-phosphate guanylyltransferase